jgi:hypothetical protein
MTVAAAPTKPTAPAKQKTNPFHVVLSGILVAGIVGALYAAARGVLSTRTQQYKYILMMPTGIDYNKPDAEAQIKEKILNQTPRQRAFALKSAKEFLNEYGADTMISLRPFIEFMIKESESADLAQQLQDLYKNDPQMHKTIETLLTTSPDVNKAEVLKLLQEGRIGEVEGSVPAGPQNLQFPTTSRSR